jgi:hypothetical protein
MNQTLGGLCCLADSGLVPVSLPKPETSTLSAVDLALRFGFSMQRQLECFLYIFRFMPHTVEIGSCEKIMYWFSAFAM